jgi:aldose 1-epimerase
LREEQRSQEEEKLRTFARSIAPIAAVVLFGHLGSAMQPARNDNAAQATKKAAVTRALFGHMADGTGVDLFTLTNPNGVEIKTIPYAAIIVSVRVPDRQGTFDDVVLGFDTFDRYAGDHPHFGAVVGRYGNRIARGRFTLDGKVFQLATNNGANHLHGGVNGFDKRLWHGEPFERGGNVGVAYTLTSRDGDESYPGTRADDRCRPFHASR